MRPHFRFWDGQRYRVPPLDACGLEADGTIVAFNGIKAWRVLDERWVVEQDTGLVDATGKPIYDGDIISFTIKGATHGREPDPVSNAQVWYYAEDAMWVFGHYADIHNGFFQHVWWYSMADELDRATLRVLGNVHEHPELLTTHPIIQSP